MGLILGNSVLNCESNTNNTNNTNRNKNTSIKVLPKTFNPGNNNNFNPNTPNNTTVFTMGPGIYAIIVRRSDPSLGETEKMYIGESSNVALRLGQHWSDLSKKKHECQGLLEDWLLFGPDNFTFISLSVGPQWNEQKVRLAAEAELLRLNLTLIYNKSIAGSTQKKQSDSYCKSVKFENQVFPSIADASKVTGVSETHIRRLIRDPQNLQWSLTDTTQTLIDDNIVNIGKAKRLKLTVTFTVVFALQLRRKRSSVAP